MLVQYVVTHLFLGDNCAEKGLISCADEKQCIDPKYWCDGYALCNDKSDEITGCGL